MFVTVVGEAQRQQVGPAGRRQCTWICSAFQLEAWRNMAAPDRRPASTALGPQLEPVNKARKHKLQRTEAKHR